MSMGLLYMLWVSTLRNPQQEDHDRGGDEKTGGVQEVCNTPRNGCVVRRSNTEAGF